MRGRSSCWGSDTPLVRWPGELKVLRNFFTLLKGSLRAQTWFLQPFLRYPGNLLTLSSDLFEAYVFSADFSSAFNKLSEYVFTFLINV